MGMTGIEDHQPFIPTHRAGPEGQPTWPAPDPASSPGPRLHPNLDVRLLERSGAWAHVVCSNGWAAWVDERQLVPVGPTLPRLFAAPAVVITATIRGSSLVGWHVRFDAHDANNDDLGSGTGLGWRGQIIGNGFTFDDERGMPALRVVPDKRSWLVTDGQDNPLGCIAPVRRGLKPVFELTSGGQLLGRMTRDGVGARRWAVTDRSDQQVAMIRDVTVLGRLQRNGSCRLDVTGPVEPPLRQLVVAAAADTATAAMRSHNKPRQWA